ncbi:Signal transduction histidine kinase [Robiginitalea myxolifaciens]|uniref:histidine kinase n=1 Tax=Robiginitalea myxolifaciens TaxID=400055 RepID=A0A1I6GXF7_9FLAO|nr:ATP-binding protein [Robiginitalea myxolifaciens]SFR46836.1 Signal transduction histidine kinase [Robiginitalea myxolifaciens]
MPSKSRVLLDQLANLKETLEGFSFENLSSEQALNLKQTFDTFRQQLESRLWLPNSFDTPAIKRTGQASATETNADSRQNQQDSDFLISMVSHEVRTPLNGITGFADLLCESDLNATQRQYAESIRAASATMLDIVNALMDYSRAREGNDIPALVPFSPEQVLREVAYLAQTLIVDRELKFEMHLPKDLPGRLFGDPSRLSQIVMNLLGNAIKFTPKGKISLTIDHVTTATHCELVCAVKDTGVGIPKQALDTIFKPYSKVKGREQVSGEGLGLGLSLVQYWIHEQGGEITVQSELEKGSTFEFNLPYELATDIPLTETVSGVEQEQITSLEGLRILIFEDNPLNMKLAETRLSQWGCQVIPAFSAREGLLRLDSENFDLVLMDLHMPEMDGFQVSRLIRRHQRKDIKHLPIIAVTADITPEVHEGIVGAGINDLIGKPFSPAVLADKILQNLREEALVSELLEHPESAGAQEIPCLNLEGLWQECNGDKEMFTEIVRLFNNGVLEFLGGLKLHTKTADYKGIRDAAHKVKAGLKMVAAELWIKQVEEIHDLARKSHEIARIRGLYEALLADYPRIETALEQEMKEYQNKS